MALYETIYSKRIWVQGLLKYTIWWMLELVCIQFVQGKLNAEDGLAS